MSPIRESVAASLIRHDLAPVVTLWFDGACEPKNPGGIATIGWIAKDADGVILGSDSREVARGPEATNNLAEWSALGFGLRWLADNPEVSQGIVLRILGDSKLVVEQLNRNWNCNKEHLQKLRARCEELLEQIKPASWVAMWIPREQNGEADALSRQAYERVSGKNFPERARR